MATRTFERLPEVHVPVLTDISALATCRPDADAGDAGVVREAALVWEGDRILWVGPAAELPAEHRGRRTLEAGGRLVVPGLIDAHTHLAFGGWRADEFARRLAGESYEEIAAAGGGIASTVERTRGLAEDALLDRCRGFAREALRLGVTTLECKSGYGLDTETELRLLRAYRRLAEEGPVRVVPTFLGAHAVPPEMREEPAGYVERVTQEMLPAVADRGLARFCDVFVEEGAFGVDAAREILVRGRELGLRPKLHADQLSDGGGAALAAEVGAASADHLEHVSGGGIEAMAAAGIVAVTLPLAGLYLDQPAPPARRLLEAGVPVAVATDFNPGTAPSQHLPLALTLACVRQRMTPAEALRGATAVAARAVGEEDRLGSLEPGRAADFAVMDAPDVEHWLYHFRGDPCRMTVVGGEVAWSAA